MRACVFDGVDAARPSRGASRPCASAELVVIGPSNPIVSIGPILAIPGMREASLAATGAAQSASAGSSPAGR